MTSRSGWDKAATQVFMMVGLMWESHQDRAQNGFLIFRGDWLAASAKQKSHSGIAQQASLNNSITIGGQEQASDQPAGEVLHFADTAQYSYFEGDASQAYNTSDRTLLTGRRSSPNTRSPQRRKPPGKSLTHSDLMRCFGI